MPHKPISKPADLDMPGFECTEIPMEEISKMVGGEKDIKTAFGILSDFMHSGFVPDFQISGSAPL